ncbi:hypothetical protein K1T71_012003 [Dendrolimus kikuchii]|uniref:Uncharacterized protein n=1 Tax=Dendrolimus kikuchii TaxID=765133 RepID=A0ACC1CKJ5_9NEOP|nr:hypothetical protein K1T71_012003 [Dendrolimus kikuchii]
MNSNSQKMFCDRKLSQIVAEESQLLMELKWIKEALVKIKTQRNCLQIERLVLENMKAQEKMREGSPGPTPRSTSEDNVRVDMITKLNSQEETCNNEELNLDISNIYRNMDNNPLFTVEEDDEMDNSIDMVIDMCMMMNRGQ